MAARALGGVRLERRAQTADVITLGARIAFAGESLRVAYPTRTGALLRIDGVAAGAFDAKHPTCDLAPSAGEHDVTLEVERSAVG